MNGYTESEQKVNGRYQARWRNHCNILTARLDSDRLATAQAEPPTAGTQVEAAFGQADLSAEKSVWRKFAEEKEKNFNRHYYGDEKGETKFVYKA